MLSHHEEECSTVTELLKYSEIDLLPISWLSVATYLFHTPAMSTHQAGFVSSGRRFEFCWRFLSSVRAGSESFVSFI